MRIPLFLFFTISLFVNSLICSAQNWNLIQLNDKHHFFKEGGEIPKHTMFVDSFHVSGSDTTFYLNRFFLPCDTCSEDGYFLDNQPGFLQCEIHKKASGMQVLMNPDTYFIQVTGTVGDTWWFDNVQTQQAEVKALETKQVFGETDSVMTIAIDGTNQIELSKNHGVLKYFDYTIGGLEYAQKGEWIPGFNEIYDFQVGDVFFYETSNLEFNAGECDRNIYLKQTIKEINRNGDTLWIKLDNKKRHPQSYTCPEIENFESIKILINDKHLSNSYHNEKVMINSNDYFPGNGNTKAGGYFINTRVMYDDHLNPNLLVENRKIVKSIGYTIEDSIYPFTEILPGLFKLYTDYSHIPYNWKKLYVEGLGKTLDSYSQFESGHLQSLLGFVKNGDTTGVVYPDSYMLDFPEDKTDILKPEVYPNPSHGNFSVDLEKPEFEVNIYAVNGKLMDSFTANSNKVYPLNYLENGLYLVKIEYKNKTHYLKWVKQ